MKGRLKKIDDKWFVEYSGVSYKGGNPKQLGGYTKKVEKKTLPLHPNFVTMTDYVWVKGVKVYDGDVVKFTEVLVNPMGREVDSNDLGQNHSKSVWYAKPYLDEKEEQKQHLIDIMNYDEDLGLYNETFDEYLVRLKDRRTEDNYKYTDEDFEKYDEYIMDSWRCGLSVYKCLEFMYFAEKEIKGEDVFNDEKREGVEKVIQQHKVLKNLSLVNPVHLEMTSNGHGEFPDSYKLTEKGIQYIIEQLNKE
jgi:hypothetical protein